jgi:hypothetical protein
MYVSRSFVYLDLQKTGTNFIVDFLRRFSNEPGEREKHKALGDRFSPDKLHFISVRDPLDQYISLYSFGCGGEGDLYRRLVRSGMKELYSRSSPGFSKWLEFVLDPANSKLVDKRYATAGEGRIPELIGLQSFRFLNLAFSDPAATFAESHSKQDLMRLYAARNIISVMIRYDHFIPDLKDLVQNHLSDAFTDVGAAVSFLDGAPPRNASDRIDRNSDLVVDSSMREYLRAREWLYYSVVEN